MHAPLFIGADLLQPKGYSIGARVQTCFERAAHLVLDDGRLLTLLCGTRQRGMRMVNVDDVTWLALRQHLGPETHVMLEASSLQGAQFHLPLSNIPVWHSPVVQGRLAQAVQNSLERGQAWLAAHRARMAHPPLWQAALKGFNAVAQMFAVNQFPDSKKLDETIGITLGLGPGLTPSADDMLGGMLIGFQVMELPEASAKRSVLLSECIQRHMHDTTIASRDLLDQSCRGWLTARFADVLSALCNEAGAPPLETALKIQSEVGEYSGVDALIGFFTALDIVNPALDTLSSSHTPLNPSLGIRKGS